MTVPHSPLRDLLTSSLLALNETIPQLPSRAQDFRSLSLKISLWANSLTTEPFSLDTLLTREEGGFWQITKVYLLQIAVTIDELMAVTDMPPSPRLQVLMLSPDFREQAEKMAEAHSQSRALETEVEFLEFDYRKLEYYVEQLFVVAGALKFALVCVRRGCHKCGYSTPVKTQSIGNMHVDSSSDSSEEAEGNSSSGFSSSSSSSAEGIVWGTKMLNHVPFIDYPRVKLPGTYPASIIAELELES